MEYDQFRGYINLKLDLQRQAHTATPIVKSILDRHIAHVNGLLESMPTEQYDKYLEQYALEVRVIR